MEGIEGSHMEILRFSLSEEDFKQANEYYVNFFKKENYYELPNEIKNAVKKALKDYRVKGRGCTTQELTMAQKMSNSRFISKIEFDKIREKVINSKEVVLLECMSNLVANEIFSPNGRKENVVDIICDGVKKINSLAEHMVIVTNDVFADGANYDESTNDYIAKLGEINCRLGTIADEVYEVAAGIPVRYK